MSDLLVRLPKIILKICQAQSDLPATAVLGHDFERREARRSALWVFCGLTFLFLIGWLVFRWKENS
jgi:hypothetical protein